jgi:hypothetical protein
MENAKLLGQRKNDAEKNIVQASKHHREINVEYRTMDKDINTVRPQLMKLQRQKDEYTRYYSANNTSPGFHEEGVLHKGVLHKEGFITVGGLAED